MLADTASIAALGSMASGAEPEEATLCQTTQCFMVQPRHREVCRAGGLQRIQDGLHHEPMDS